LIPVATIGHLIGLKLHDKIIQNDALFKRWVGAALLLISSFKQERLTNSIFAK
jgi:hypothetical protein